MRAARRHWNIDDPTRAIEGFLKGERTDILFDAKLHLVAVHQRAALEQAFEPEATPRFRRESIRAECPRQFGIGMRANRRRGDEVRAGTGNNPRQQSFGPQRLDYPRMKQPQGGAPAEHQRRAAEALSRTLEKPQLGSQGKIREIPVAQFVKCGGNLVKILGQQPLGTEQAVRNKASD